MKGFLAWCRRVHAGYVRFVEKQGFFLVLGVCVAVIAATALWTGGESAPPAAPTPPVDPSAAQAAQLEQERLAEAAAPTPSPTPAPAAFEPPLRPVRVVQAFDAARLSASGDAGLWQLHDACDLAAQTGQAVLAMADGVVTEVAEDSPLLCQVTVDHGGGMVAQYAGMAALAGLQAGDPVRQGQTLGFCGAGPLTEQALGPHLHLRVTREGQAVDPTLLWP